MTGITSNNTERRVGDMKCDDAKKLISLYIDNEMDEKIHSEFEDHIKTCKTCRDELNAISKTVELLRSIPQVELPVNFKEELHEKLVKLKEENQKSRKGLFFIKNKYIKAVSTIAAGAFVIFALRGLFFNNFLAKSSLNQAKGDAEITKAVETENVSESYDLSDQVADLSQAYTGENAIQADEILSMRSFIAEGDEDINSDDKAVVKENENFKLNMMEEKASTIPDYTMPEKVDRGEAGGISMASFGIQPRQNAVYFTEDAILKDAAVRVRINIYNDAVKVGVVEEIVQNYKTWNVIANNDNIDNKNDNISIIEFNIKGLDYESLVSKLNTEIDKLNLIVEYDNPVLLQEVEPKYREYSTQLEEINSQILALPESKDASLSSKESKLKEEKNNIENNIKALLADYDYIADAEVHIKEQ